MTKEERQRYVKFRIFSTVPVSLDDKALAQCIWREYKALYGEIKSGKAGFWIIEYNDATQQGTIRCAHTALDELVTTLALTTSINDSPVSIDTVKTSGMLGKVVAAGTTSS